MTLCNNAFVDLASKMEDILSSSFEESPRGDKARVNKVADNLIKLLTNSYFSLTWVNSKFAQETIKTPIDYNDTRIVLQIAQIPTLKKSLDKAIASVKTWSVTKKFESCRFCDSCGGDYPVYGGEGLRKPEVGWWLRFGDKCTGTL